jgi:hypothetical protein
MKRFIQTKFFRLLKKNGNIRMSSLNSEYDEFAAFLFAEHDTMRKTDYRSALVYTRRELISLAEVSEKKVCSRF